MKLIIIFITLSFCLTPIIWAKTIPLNELQKKIGATPFIDGPANLRDAPKGKLIQVLKDFSRVEIVQIKDKWIQVKTINGPKEKKGWLYKGNFKFPRAKTKNEFCAQVYFGIIVEGAEEEEDESSCNPKIETTTNKDFPLILSFPATDMTSGAIILVGKKKNVSLDIPGRIFNTYSNGDHVIFNTDIGCINLMIKLPFTDMIKNKGKMKANQLHVTKAKVYLSPKDIFDSKDSKKIIILKDQKYIFKNINTIELLQSHREIIINQKVLIELSSKTGEPGYLAMTCAG